MAIPLGQFVEQQVAMAGRNGRGSGMVTRLAMVVLILLAAGSACAESLTPDAARRFVTGKLFAFNCFDGSRGAGRIYGDGSVIGTIQFRGAGPARTVSLPAGTLRVRGEAVCASLQGMPFEPCFQRSRSLRFATSPYISRRQMTTACDGDTMREVELEVVQDHSRA